VVQPGVPEDQALLLIDALRRTGTAGNTQDDLVTMLWQGNLTHIQLETVPIEQTIYLSEQQAGSRGSGQRGLSYAWTPKGEELRGELGQMAGPHGLHRDMFDDWDLPDGWADVLPAFAKLEAQGESARQALLDEWAEESKVLWTDRVPMVMRQVLALDPSEDSRSALAYGLATWLASALQRCDWFEAQQALKSLRGVDADGALSATPLADALGALDVAEIAERLDEDDAQDQARFSSLMVALGRPALDIACNAMCRATKVRVRAAAITAVSYMCSDHPDWLTPYVTDSRWQMVRNVVFVLGQIGGEEIVPLLQSAAEHGEARVRRAVVQALGAVPSAVRLPILIRQLNTRDTQLLSACLNMMTRDRDPRAARAILARIQQPDFESRSEENKRALFSALGEVADDSMIPALDVMLNEGGWFARRTVERLATARTLRRIGTERALQVLEAGMRSKSEAVRSACLEAMSAKRAA
jgi:HEAT repeat protein